MNNMAEKTLSKGGLFPQKLVKEVTSKVKGKSSLTKLSGSEPLPFNGKKEFIFTQIGRASCRERV